ncbi:hypothetical protein D6Z43_09830 [Pseudomonas sp. DY-1]|uniref:hypothetical protein n=1 Tax=Pseudomonas sp. DY-1 TaxID=1755504 RepID=UPI000EAA3A97|nr:hypothetical protein [Pseudomonas sp. DY-1]AYF87435.1 hypothetical protein D6Z43_09830 [Pseudomonas sp. DY-1]
MRVLPFLVAFLLFSSVASQPGQVIAGDKWEDEYRDGPCRVKEVSDKGDYKLEVKCPDGRGRTWPRGEWKDEYWDGPCRVKVEAKRDEYKKEVKCEDD